MNETKATGKLNRRLIVVLFAVLFVLVLTSVTYMLRTGGDTKDRFMGFYAEPKNSLDIVMVGSSPTYSGCSFPQLYGEYGIKAYALASNVQRPVAGMYLVEEARKTQDPKLYMFEMRMYTGDEGGLISNMAYTREVTDNMRYSINRIKTINAMLESGWIADDADKVPYTYYFDIFKYHSNWKSLRSLSQWQSWRFKRPSETKGYKITDKVGPTDMPEIIDAEPAEKLDYMQGLALTDLLDYLNKNNLKALFYVLPYKLADGDQEKYALIRDTVENAGYSFLDMNQYYDEIGIDFAVDFSDYGIHTNAIGAKKCTEFLGDYLKDNYDLPDHRKETGGKLQKENESWEKAYEKWEKDVVEAEQIIYERIENEDYFVLEE